MTNDKSIVQSDDSLCGRDVLINDIPFRIHQIIHQGSDSRIFSVSSLKGGGDSAFVVKNYCCRRDSEVWNKAMREIEAGNLLSGCPHIARLRGYSVVSDRQETGYNIFLLFDRMPCLDDLAVDTRGALEVCRDISLALEEMRRKGLVHGDVKPSNIFRCGCRWILGDLGSVFPSGKLPEDCTEGYCSPEALRGEVCDIRSDIYSLGITLYKLLSGGKLPFCDAPCDEIAESDVYRAIEIRLSGVAIAPISGMPDDVNQLLLKMCRFRRRDRFRKPGEAARSASKILDKAYSTDNA